MTAAVSEHSVKIVGAHSIPLAKKPLKMLAVHRCPRLLRLVSLTSCCESEIWEREISIPARLQASRLFEICLSPYQHLKVVLTYSINPQLRLRQQVKRSGRSKAQAPSVRTYFDIDKLGTTCVRSAKLLE